MNDLFLTTLSTLKAWNSPYMQHYFKRFFVLHSSEAIFSFLIKKSRQNAIETEIAFFHSLGNSRDGHWIISFMLHISFITSPTNWYLYWWVSWNISEVINENSTSAFNYLDDFRLLKNVRCKNGCAMSIIGKLDLLFGFNDSITLSSNKFVFRTVYLFLTTLSTLKAWNSPHMQHYFKRFFVLHSSEAIFSFLIKKSRQNAIEIETAFFHSLGNSKGRTLDHFFYASHIHHNLPYKLLPILMS